MSAEACVACGGPDPLRLGLCPTCGPAPQRHDAVVFVDAGARADERGRALQALHEVFGDAVGAAARRVAAGGRPLLRLPRGLADRAATRLARMGVPARAVPAVAAWTRMPWHFFLMVALVVITGALAGTRAAPSMLWTTPLYAALLGVAAQQGMRRPALLARSGRGLGAPARTVASAALADLPDGEARRLLATIVRLADGVLALDARAADADDLVIAAADTAREVALLASACTTLEQRASIDGAARSAHRRDAGLVLLRRAMAALGSLSAAGGPGADQARQRLTDIVQAMEAESAAALAAALEVGRLLERA